MAPGPKAFFPEQVTLLNAFVLINERPALTKFVAGLGFCTERKCERDDYEWNAANRLQQNPFRSHLGDDPGLRPDLSALPCRGAAESPSGRADYPGRGRFAPPSRRARHADFCPERGRPAQARRFISSDPLWR